MKPMAVRDWLEMLLLAAVWGASFLFLRIAAPQVGPVAVAAFRITGAALVLLPSVLWRGQWRQFKGRWPTLVVACLLSCILPFVGLSRAAQTLPAGPLSVLNATTPMWAAVIGWACFGEAMGWRRICGLLLGLLGVTWLAKHRAGGLEQALDPAAVGLALGSTWMYAVAIHHSRHFLKGMAPVTVSAGILLCGGALTLVPALAMGPLPLHGPAGPSLTLHALAQESLLTAWLGVPARVWLSLAGLATACTGLAYALFYRLVDRIGATRAVSVTFLIPPFAMLWSHLWLDEAINLHMLLGAGVVLLGTLLAAKPSGSALNEPVRPTHGAKLTAE
jgi:drug/metabolite transporter (DMT)-like permease